jgi:hydrogenase maturation factor
VSDLLPVGKLPPKLLAELLSQAPITDGRVLFPPGIGLDCAVVDLGERLLVLKSDPITFASDQVGWYAVQVNANDISTTGAVPSWFLPTVLLPESAAEAALARAIFDQIYAACRALGISVVGGHTEVTYGLDRPVVAGTLVGEVSRSRLVTPRGVRPGDRLLLTKGVPVEATALLARERAASLQTDFSEDEIRQASGFLYDPGISVVRDAQAALDAGRVNAMHDPTEGGLYAAVWELAAASGCTLVIDPLKVPVPALSRRLCAHFGIDPLGAIASGALLLTAPEDDTEAIMGALEAAGISCADVGCAEAGEVSAWQETGGVRTPLPWPEQDEIARLFAQT